MSTPINILTDRRKALATELEYQQGQRAALLAAIDALPTIISDLEGDIAELDSAIATLSS